MLPVVRDDKGLLPFIHLDDAVSATIAALDRAPAGSAYDIVDDHPASMSEVVGGLARQAGAPRPFSRAAVGAAPALAVHGGLHVDPSAAVECESARRDGVGAEVSDLARGPGWHGRPRGKPMTDVSAFDEHRPLLFSIAYRMLGSAADAEDVVQDAWLRYRGADDVRSPRAFAATIVTRLCLDRLKSARTLARGIRRSLASRTDSDNRRGT